MGWAGDDAAANRAALSWKLLQHSLVGFKGSGLQLLAHSPLLHFYEKIYPEMTFCFVHKGLWDGGFAKHEDDAFFRQIALVIAAAFIPISQWDE